MVTAGIFKGDRIKLRTVALVLTTDRAVSSNGSGIMATGAKIYVLSMAAIE